MIKGVVLWTKQEEVDNPKIGRLVAYGAEHIHFIKLGRGERWRQFTQAFRGLGAEDVAVVVSLDDVCEHRGMLIELFSFLADNPFRLVSLEQGWLEDCVGMMRGLETTTSAAATTTTTATGATTAATTINTIIKKSGTTLKRKGAANIKKKGQTKQQKQVKGVAATVAGGRPKGSIKMTDENLEQAVKMYCQGDFTVKDICRIVECNERSMYRYLRMKGVTGKRKNPLSEASTKHDKTDNNRQANAGTAQYHSPLVP